jgi:hypothetical protein
MLTNIWDCLLCKLGRQERTHVGILVSLTGVVEAAVTPEPAVAMRAANTRLEWIQNLLGPRPGKKRFLKHSWPA